MTANRILLPMLLALSPIGYAQAVKVSVVPVESADDFRNWLGKPVNAERAASPSRYPDSIKSLPIGRKTQLPILVTGLPSPAPSSMQLVADVEVMGSDGRSLGTWPRCCTASIAKGSNTSAVLLSQTVIVQPESGRRTGSYTVKVSVTDGQQTWTASEVLPYGDAEGPGAAREAPRLRMSLPAREETGDRRDCLGLATPAEVIKCSEKKR
jgi:hypothetical protein